MKDTPTPRTDDARRRFQQLYDAGKLDVAIEQSLLDMALFEMELTAAREEVEIYKRDNKQLRKDVVRIASTLKDFKEQRDRLAEAVERIANNNVQDTPETDYAYELGRMEGIAKVALQSLKQNASVEARP